MYVFASRGCTAGARNPVVEAAAAARSCAAGEVALPEENQQLRRQRRARGLIPKGVGMQSQLRRSLDKEASVASIVVVSQYAKAGPSNRSVTTDALTTAGGADWQQQARSAGGAAGTACKAVA